MQHDDPGSPEAWLVRAKSDLLLAKLGERNDILLNQLCFHAQQTAEKSSFFDELAILTDYAVSTRYPGDYEEILEAKEIELAELVFKWANHLIKN
ncbi:HEPN domain-containing protein [Leptospira kanakyensis]|uniref:DNA-binding protein n=1 Tax=Leptospira kanakyensis TaxID=2484968 RepID=UPI00223E8303|nr:DNA-binding protein [Leptospira kanakyensis]MCW7480771.1 HEPN domain-containing protein [Leptospira kanakyensis]